MTKLTNLCTAAVIFPLVGNINNISVQKSHKVVTPFDCSAVIIQKNEYNSMINSGKYESWSTTKSLGGWNHTIHYSQAIYGESRFYYNTDIAFKHTYGKDTISVELNDYSASGLSASVSGGISCEVNGSGASLTSYLTISTSQSLSFKSETAPIEKYDESGTYYLFVVDIRRDAIMRSTRTVDGRTEEVYTKIKYLPYSVCTELRMKKANSPYIPYCG